MTTDGARIAIEHETRYVHAGRVSTSQHVAYLTPRALPRQRVRVARRSTIDPAPAEPSAADRLLRQRRRPVHDPDAVRRAARASSRSVVEVRARRAADRPGREPGRGKTVRDAAVYERGAPLRRRVGVPLSVAVRRRRRRSWRRSPASRSRRGGRSLAAADRPDAPDPRRVHVRSRRDDDHDAGHARARGAPRRLPGLRAPADRAACGRSACRRATSAAIC